jgi:hypothetical protein
VAAVTQSGSGAAAALMGALANTNR